MKETKPDLDYLTASIERVTFHNQDNGFCVLRANVKGHRDLITIIGNAATVHAGEQIECYGTWINDKNFGLQFKAQELKTITPTTMDGIEKYLSSGMVKGVGAYFAKKLIDSFGKDVLHVIESDPERLINVDGIGEKRKELIVSSWHEQKSIRNIMIFFQTNGVGTARSVRIYKIYGDQAIPLIQENPYRLATDIRGIGFKTADELAQKLGISSDSILRAKAGVLHVIHELCSNGHCAVLLNELISTSTELLQIPQNIIETAIAEEIITANIMQEQIQDQTCIYPRYLYNAEVQSAQHLKRLNSHGLPWGEINLKVAIDWVEKNTMVTLSQSQQQAIYTVLASKISIITGGPGVGKTTLVNSILKIILSKKLAIALCAPTGRAAKRLTETTNITAKTIHRLLEIEPKSFVFKHNQNNPLPIDVIIIDESSMLDIVLFNNLLKAIPTHAAVIFVGDIDQLPSVGSGAVLADLIASKVIATVRLTEIFRQAASSRIIVNAHRVNSGQMPLPNEGKTSDFFTLYVDTPEAIHDELINLINNRLPNFYNCNPILDIQVLTPMNRGGLGSRALNIALQNTLNSNSEPKITKFGTTFAPGDKIIQIVNNYDKEIFNGDIGFIERINLDDGVVTIRFDQQIKQYDTNELDEINLAYAISIHKSQGSEFPIIVMPVATQHYTLLARNLLYTGITRGKQLVVLIAQKKAIGMAINNNKQMQRLTKLAIRVQN